MPTEPEILPSMILHALPLKLHPPSAVSILFKLEIIRTQSEVAQNGIPQPFKLVQHLVLLTLYRFLLFALYTSDRGCYGGTLGCG